MACSIAMFEKICIEKYVYYIRTHTCIQSIQELMILERG